MPPLEARELPQIMNSCTLSAVCRVGAIPELLDMVFQFLDDASNATNALVSRQWSEIALDNLWKEVSDLHPLFNTLAPLEIVDNSYMFVRPLVLSDWERFDRYRYRVRKLSFRQLYMHSIHHSVFDAIARSRLTLDILPNLSTLEWDDPPLDLCVVFMHKNVKSLILRLPDDNVEEVVGVFADVVQRMPNLCHLDLCFDCSVVVFEAAIIRLFSNLPTLERINLPPFCLTSNIAEAVSSIKTLQILGYEYYEEQGSGIPADIVTFRPTFSEGSFSSLHDLSMTLSYANAHMFLANPFAPANLTSLYLNSFVLEPPAVFLTLTSIIPKKCPLLKSLYLNSFDVLRFTSLPSSPPGNEFISIETLRPLFQCVHLTYLEIEHRHPLHLDPTDIEEISTSWSNIEVLELNPQPVYAAHADLDLGALLPFARNCHKLRRLGLFLDASTDYTFAPDQVRSTLPKFVTLRQLSMGASPIKKINPVVRFLSRICPLHCTIVDEGSWVSDLIRWKPDIHTTIQARLRRWKEVDGLLPLVMEVRCEERERIRLLEEELQVLRNRVKYT